jgi:hypothetical protein
MVGPITIEALFVSARIRARKRSALSQKAVNKMEMILELQSLELPEEFDVVGNSGTSSPGGCCNGATAEE